MSDNRIQQVGTIVTGARQTPPDFSRVLANVAAEGLSVVGGLIGGMAAGSPVLSTAVAGIQAVTGMAKATGIGGTFKDEAGAAGGGATGTATGGGSDAMELMRMQQAMQAESTQMNAMYLQMQQQMQRENREYTALTNIMKVRHDSAKSAINNVR
jgi:hypothetical protein